MAVHAQTEGLVMRSQIVQGGGNPQACPVLLISFNHELSLVGQSNDEAGQVLTVRLAPGGANASDPVLEDHVETEPSLVVAGLGTAFVTMTVADAQPVMSIRFSAAAASARAVQAGPQSMVITMFAEDAVCDAPATVPDEGAATPDMQASLGDADVETQATALLTEARGALIDKDFDHSVQVLTKLLELPRNSKSADAQELLGVARERNGQMAHAKAEYEIYLKDYPDAAGVDRVRQRLLALETAEGAPPPGLHIPGPSKIFKALGFGKKQGKVSMTSIPRRNETFPPLGPQPGPRGSGRRDSAAMVLADGSVVAPDGGPVAEEDPFRASITAYYYTNQATTWITELDKPTKDVDTEVLQNTLVLSFDMSDAFKRNGDTYSYRLSGEYQEDFTDAGKSRLNLSRVYGELDFGDNAPKVSFGRQSWNDDATVGRYDGLRVSYPVSDNWQLNALAGTSVNKKSDPMFGGDMKVLGVSADFLGLGKRNKVSGYVATEVGGGFTERLDFGVEGSYSTDSNSYSGLVEFEQSIGALNIARLNWNHVFKNRSSFSLGLDYSRSSSLGLSNALSGEKVRSLGELSGIYSMADIKRLAKERAPATTTISAAWQKSLNDKWQLSIDGSAYSTEGTPASAGVPDPAAPMDPNSNLSPAVAAVAPTGWNYQLSGQVVGSSVLATDDMLSLSARIGQDTSSDLIMLDGYWRYRVSDKLKVTPRLKVAHRNFASGTSTETFAIPSLTLNYSVNDKADLELEVGSRLSTKDTPTFGEESNETYLVAGFAKQF